MDNTTHCTVNVIIKGEDQDKTCHRVNESVTLEAEKQGNSIMVKVKINGQEFSICGFKA